MSNTPRIIFFGTPRFGAIVLSDLLDAGIVPVALVCNPDKPTGRKHVLTAPATKQVVHDRGLDHTITVYQPDRLASIADELRAHNADVFIIASYNKIISQRILDIPRHGTLGVHPSLLPAYRGPSPIQHQLLDGCTTVGTTLFLVDAEVDHGPIVAAATMSAHEHTTYIELETDLAHLGAQLVIASLTSYITGALLPQEQDHDHATSTRKFAPDDGYVAWDVLQAARTSDTRTARRISRMIHAITPEPGVWTLEPTGMRLKLLSAHCAASTGLLVLDVVQRAGKRPGPYTNIA